VKKLYVGNLSFESNEQELKAWFAAAGFNVDKVTLIRDNYTDRLRGFGFVEITSDEEAERAIQALNGKEFMGRNLTVNEARPRREGGFRREGGGPPRGGRGGGHRNKGPRW